MISLALYQPDIPGNVGSAIRLGAGLGIPLHIIEPCGFPWDERKIRTAALDYRDHVNLTRHESWSAFQTKTKAHRVILMTTKTTLPYWDFAFQPGDILMAGRESAGVPPAVHQSAPYKITIPMAGSLRSLNVINACAMVVGEALRQTRIPSHTLTES
ncbi:MAG: tRNA (cytidine(34)-2'-O)-methyltransferase [Alphaproteobacteria bacterium]|nr:tRNA (cytidine(34)-2'-O)-methyltransferase [Alphaproteobacteria bacterium]